MGCLHVALPDSLGQPPNKLVLVSRNDREQAPTRTKMAQAASTSDLRTAPEKSGRLSSLKESLGV